MHKNIIDPNITELIEWMNLCRAESERKKNMIRTAARTMGRTPSDIEVERAGLEDDKKADAIFMVINTLMTKKLEASSVQKMASDLQLITVKNGEIEVIKPVEPTATVVAKIEDPKMAQKAEELIAEDEIEKDIYNAVKGNRKEEARSIVEHMYRDVPEVINNVDNFIITIVKKQADQQVQKFGEEVGFDRTCNPLTTPEEVAKVQFQKAGKFNFAIFIKDMGKSKTEDRVKLAAIQLFTTGQEGAAINTIHTFFGESKGWDKTKSREFLLTLMKKDPHKELNTVLYNLLEYNKQKKGDAKLGIKFCRQIVGAYLEKNYIVAAPGKALDELQVKANKEIDRYINRQLKALESK
jgi:hypothetical protein